MLNTEIRPPHIYGHDCGEYGLLTIRRMIASNGGYSSSWTVAITGKSTGFVAVVRTGKARTWPSAEDALHHILSTPFLIPEFDEAIEKYPPPSALSDWQPLEPDQSLN